MTISGRFVVNAISVGNMKSCFKSVATCQSVQPTSNGGLRIFLRASFEIFPFNELNCSAVDNNIYSFSCGLTTYFRNLSKDLQDFIMSPSIAS